MTAQQAHDRFRGLLRSSSKKTGRYLKGAPVGASFFLVSNLCAWMPATSVQSNNCDYLAAILFRVVAVFCFNVFCSSAASTVLADFRRRSMS